MEASPPVVQTLLLTLQLMSRVVKQRYLIHPSALMMQRQIFVRRSRDYVSMVT